MIDIIDSEVINVNFVLLKFMKAENYVFINR